MATVNIHRDSFNAGEISPTLASRYAVEKVGSGCRIMRNMYPHAHGPALRRPGTKFLGEAQGYASSLRAFTFSAKTTALLEFSPSGLGVWQDGERVPINPVDLPYDDEDCQELQIVQVNDVCYIAHKNHPPAKLVRWSDTDWRYSELTFKWPPLGDENFRSDEVATPTVTTVLTEACPATTGNGATYVLAANTDWRAEFTAGAGMAGKVYVQRLSGASWVNEMEINVVAGTTTSRRGRKFTSSRSLRFRFVGTGMSGTGYIKTLAYPTASAVTLACSATSGTGLTLTASNAVFTNDHVGSYWQITHARENAHTQIVAAVPTISAASSTAIKVVGAWSLNTYGSWDATLYLEKQIGGAWETLRSYSASKDRNIIDSGTEDNPVMMRLRVSAGTSVAVSSGAGVTGAAVPRFVLENREARISGLVKVTAVGALNPEGKATTATVDVISELHSTAATSIWTEGAFSEERGYPWTVALHGGRLWFGGTDKEPQRVWGSVVNDFENFRLSTYDDAALSFTPASQRSNTLQWMASYGEYLVMGTTMDEWTATGSNGFITPLDLSVRRRSGYGSAYQQAQFVGESLVFVARDKRHLRQIVPRTAADSEEWSAVNLNALADHLVPPEEEILQFAVQNSPVSVVWAALSDGTLIGLTFERDQNIFAWHRHDYGTQDHSFTSVACVPDPTKDFVYFAKHSILDPASGADIQYYSIERFHNEVFERNWSDAAYLDSYINQAVTFSVGSPRVITGLLHLVGLSPVVYHKDNKNVLTHTEIVDDTGTLTLPSSVVGLTGNYRIGMPFTSQLQMMRFDVPLRDGTSQGRKWKTSRVMVKLISSRGGTISDGERGAGDTEKKHNIELPTASIQPADFEFETAVAAITRDGCDVTLETSDAFGMNVQAIVWKGEISGE